MGGGQLSASLERSINNTWENMNQGQGSDDLQEMIDNDSLEVENTELFKSGNFSVSIPNFTFNPFYSRARLRAGHHKGGDLRGSSRLSR